MGAAHSDSTKMWLVNMMLAWEKKGPILPALNCDPLAYHEAYFDNSELFASELFILAVHEYCDC